MQHPASVNRAHTEEPIDSLCSRSAVTKWRTLLFAAGAAWVAEFLAYAKENGAAVDFVTTHAYGVDHGFLDEKGESDQKLSPSPDAIIGDVRRVREHISQSPFPNLPLHFTEWSTSYNPRDSMHDSYICAAYTSRSSGEPGTATGHELLGLHRLIRGTRFAADAIPRRIRFAHTRRHS